MQYWQIRIKKAKLSLDSFGVSITYFPEQLPAKYCHAVYNSPADCYGHKKRAKLSLDSFGVGITYLPGQSPAKYCRRKRA